MRRLVAICLLVLAVAGCGSENGDEPATPAGTEPATTEKRSDYGY